MDDRIEELKMQVDDLKEALDATYACVGCTERSCRDCEVKRIRLEALSDE